MKKKEWVNPNKMLMESGHKTFDQQTTCITTGNVIGDTQTSFFVRPHTATECGGLTWPQGHLRGVDMENWRLPRLVRDSVMQLTETQQVILYQFHHWNGPKKVVHGYVVTTGNHTLLDSFVTGPTYKSAWVIREATKYVTD